MLRKRKRSGRTLRGDAERKTRKMDSTREQETIRGRGKGGGNEKEVGKEKRCEGLERQMEKRKNRGMETNNKKNRKER